MASKTSSSERRGRVTDVDYLRAVTEAHKEPGAERGVLPSQVGKQIGRSEVTSRLKLRELEKQGLLNAVGRGTGGSGRKTYKLSKDGEKAIRDAEKAEAEAPAAEEAPEAEAGE